MAAAKPLKQTGGRTIKEMASTDVIPIANLATGTPDGTKFIRDDGTLQTVSVIARSSATRLFNYFNHT